MSGRTAVYALLSYAYSATYGAPLPEIKKTPNGKPYFPSKPDIHFSLSHARTHVLCALSDCPVGADIESPRTISDRVANYFCSTDELAHFEPLELWVLKESYIKLIDATLPSIKHLRFSRKAGEITPPDTNAKSKLLYIGNCIAAVSTVGEAPLNDVRIVETSLLIAHSHAWRF